MKLDVKKFIIILVITLVIGCLPSLLVNMNFLDNIVKPSFYPPKLAFPIVWTILFILMSLSLALVINKGNKRDIIIYAVQLLVNSIWLFIFFGAKQYQLGFIWIILLFILVLVMAIFYYRENKISFYLLIPYLIWLCIAFYLNLNIFLLN